VPAAAKTSNMMSQTQKFSTYPPQTSPIMASTGPKTKMRISTTMMERTTLKPDD
jgi:hypothetical protein